MGQAGCAVPNCQPHKLDARHRFPNPNSFLNMFLTWLQIINNAPLMNLDPALVYKNYRVCDKHFVREDHTSNNRLRKIAYPQLYLPSNPLEPNHDHTYAKADHTSSIPSSSDLDRNNYVEQCQQYDHCYTTPSPATPGTVRCSTPIIPKRGLLRNIGVNKSCELSPKAKRMYNQALYFKKKASALTKKNMDLRRRLQTIEKCSREQSFLNLTRHFNRTAFHFFKRQVQSFGKQPKGRRFDIEDKVLALALYKQSPAAYKLLSALFVLPSRVTLQKMLARIPIFPGIHDAVFTTLKAVCKKMKHHDKYCVLMFDEMSIEPHLQYNQFLDEVDGLEDFGEGKKTEKIANHVQVYMLRGIASNWKQPVGYFYVNGGIN